MFQLHHLPLALKNLKFQCTELQEEKQEMVQLCGIDFNKSKLPPGVGRMTFWEATLPSPKGMGGE